MFFVTIVTKRGDTKNLCKKRGQRPPLSPIQPTKLRLLLRVQAENYIFASCNLAHRYATFLYSLDYLTRPKKSSWATN